MAPAEPAHGELPYAELPYAELHCHSNFSFLDGASHPEALVAEAVRRGLSALALTDHDGLYGVVRFHEAARAAGLATVFGAELTLSPAGPRTGEPDPTGHHLVVLARDPAGYARLSRKLADAHLAGGEKGRPLIRLEDLADAHGGHWQVLTGCRKGPVPAALLSEGPRAARRQLDRLVDVFGRDRLAVELWDHGDPVDSTRNDALALLAAQAGVDLVATNNVHYASPADFPLATTLAAVRAGRSLDQLAGWLPASASAALRSGAEQARRFARWPGAVARAAEIGAACAFDLQLVAPRLPAFRVPPGHTEQSWLVELVRREAPRRYGRRGPGAVAGAWERLDHELAVIGEQGFPGYFLTVWDIVRFCRQRNIYCQGRGSAATSAVCFVLGITVVDAVYHHLLFERFLSPIREGAPDIDLDIESGRREEVIQYVYRKYDRRHTAQVANVITYRHRSAVREVGKALGHGVEEIDGWAKATDRGQSLGDRDDVPPLVRGVAGQLLGFPRHLGIHSGGMVICDRPVVDVCPVEPARMANRTVLQWDKDDCATIGLVKFDLLGLGMLEALHHMVDLVAEHHGVSLDLADLPQDDPAVYDLLCRADTVGVFQVESRAQMGTLPRVRPRNLYELAIEVALIRPGPIQGDAVHPYIRRKQGEERVVYLHPSLERIMKPELERILERTKGVPLFQEQLMEITVEVAGLSAVEADELRRAMSHKRSGQLMAGLRQRLFAGMTDRKVPADVQRDIFDRLASFTSFGFPESHALSFAALVYSSAWLKLHYPAAFTAGLLNAQPMGFWSPQSLLADAKRHGVVVHRPDVNASAAGARPAMVDPADDIRRAAAWSATGLAGVGTGGLDASGPREKRRLDPTRPAIRLGLASIRFVGPAAAERLAAGQPWSSQEELVRRGGLARPQLEALALAGALDGLPGDPAARSRRTLVWTAGAAAQATPGHLPGIVTGATAPPLPVPAPLEVIADDLWAIGVTPERTAIELVRPTLTRRGVVPARTLLDRPVDGRVTVAGVVTHRQQPETARGAVFLNLEDETGLVNVTCSPGAWTRWRSVARTSPALVVRGRLERSDGVVNVVAERFEPLPLGPVPGSRDFR